MEESPLTCRSVTKVASTPWEIRGESPNSFILPEESPLAWRLGLKVGSKPRKTRGKALMKGSCSFRLREESPLHRNVKRFRDGLLFKAHSLCVSLNSRLESNKEEEEESPLTCSEFEALGLHGYLAHKKRPPPRTLQ